MTTTAAGPVVSTAATPGAKTAQLPAGTQKSLPATEVVENWGTGGVKKDFLTFPGPEDPADLLNENIFGVLITACKRADYLKITIKALVDAKAHVVSSTAKSSSGSNSNEE